MSLTVSQKKLELAINSAFVMGQVENILVNRGFKTNSHLVNPNGAEIWIENPSDQLAKQFPNPVHTWALGDAGVICCVTELSGVQIKWINHVIVNKPESANGQ